MKKIALLGSTGSIGKSTLRVVQHLSDSLEIAALACQSNFELISEQIHIFKPKMACISREDQAEELRRRFPAVEIFSGEEGLKEIVSDAEVDFVVMAIAGMAALKPTIWAIEAKKAIGLASKEVLVSAGELISSLAKQNNIPFLPIDSEHSAIFQCLEGRNINDVNRIVLTASGGPFRNHTEEQLSHVTVEEALAHPNWNMGPKVTIDSSTLINKGLEMIEARWLFHLPPEKIEVVIHPQSIVHSFVEFVDGSLLAQINEPSMIYPIQYALTYPERKPGLFPPFDFVKNHQLTFYPPDLKKFPGLRLAQESMMVGESTPAFFNAANEVLVERFIQREISWKSIPTLLEKLLSRHKRVTTESLETILSVDQEAREEARSA